VHINAVLFELETVLEIVRTCWTEVAAAEILTFDFVLTHQLFVLKHCLANVADAFFSRV
jgi:hypothetical protein